MNLEQLKIQVLDYFSDLKFDPELHRYAVEGRPLKYSVSGIIKKYSNPFDADKIAPYSAKKAGVSVQEIKAQWKSANRLSLEIGNAAHDFGELHALDRSIVPMDGYQEAIANFWASLPEELEVVFVELRMYHKGVWYAGTMDIFLYNKISGNFIIADYKTNKDLFKNYKGQMLRGKFSDLLDNPFNKYQIQLNYYQELIEQIPGINVSQRKVIWVKPDGTFEVLDCENFQDRITERQTKTKRKWHYDK